jgi:hypothetical protein
LGVGRKASNLAPEKNPIPLKMLNYGITEQVKTHKELRIRRRRRRRRKIFGSKRKEMTGEWRRLRNK